MTLEKVSIISGKLRRIDLPITKEELKRWEKGELIQDVWPHLSFIQRDYIQFGNLPEDRENARV